MQLSNNGGKSPRLLNEHETADYLNVSVATMRRWRLLKQGPVFRKLGACVRYRPEDIEAFIAGGCA